MYAMVISKRGRSRLRRFLLWEVAWNPTAMFDERGAMLTF
jgi:hypothetical protein